MSGQTSSEIYQSPVPVVYENMEAQRHSGKEHMLEIVDEIEKQVETLRNQAAYLENEKESIVTAIDTIRHSIYVEELMEDEKADILHSLERLSERVGSVEVAVVTRRDAMQEDALSEVNDLINRMVVDIERDTLKAKALCYQFLNTCVSDPDSGPIDKMFETALLGCTLDDQKRIRKRLHGLMHYLEHSSVSML